MRGVLTAVTCALALLLGVAPAQAQTSGTLVSNISQTGDGTAGAFDKDNAQAFITGTYPLGYKLTSVTLRTESTSADQPTYSVRIRSNSSEAPGDLLENGTLTNPTSLPSSATDSQFTAPNDIAILARNTKYWVVYDAGDASTGTGNLYKTTSGDEDAGAATGWTIGDQSRFRDKDSTAGWTSDTGAALRITVQGYAVQPTVSSAAVAGTMLALTFNAALDRNSTPAPTAFSVTAGTTTQTPTGVTIHGPVVTLTLGTAVQSSDTVTVSYTPGTSPLQGLAATPNKVATFSGQTVTNQTDTAAIARVVVVSMPSHDADMDGTKETYVGTNKIRVQLTFGTAVTVTGTPQLNIKMDPNFGEFSAPYTSGSGTTALTFVHTVGGSNVSTKGIAVPQNTLALNGGTITATSGGTNATLTHTGLAHDPFHQVNQGLTDHTVPKFLSAAVNGRKLTLLFDEDLDAASAPAGNAFTVSGGRTVTGTTIAGQTATLTLNSAVVRGETVTVSYTRPTSNPLQDTAGNDAENFTGEDVTNNSLADDTPPAFESATVNGKTLTVTFDETLDTGSAPAGRQFAVRATPPGGSARDIYGTGTASLGDATATVTLASAVARGETVTVSYTKPDTNPLQDAAGNAVADFSGQTVTNNSDPALLVSNIGQASTGGAGFSWDYTQAFRTGDNDWKLTHVDLEMRSTASTPPTYTVSIYESQGVYGEPSLFLGELTNPTTPLPTSFGTVRFTAPDGIDLSSNRHYTIVVDVSAGDDSTEWRTTDASAEDAGGVGDWRILDNAHWRDQDSTGTWAAGGRTAKIAIHGFVRDTTAPTLLGGTINGTAVKLYFSEDLDTTATLVAGQFTVTGSSTGNLGTASNLTVDTAERHIVTLTVATGANNSETATIAITTTAGIQDPAGNALAAVSSFALTNTKATFPGAPDLVSSVVLHDRLTLTYNQRLLLRFPPTSAFTVTVVGGPSRTVTGLVITPGTSSSTVVLTLSTPVQRTDRVGLHYSTASTPTLQNEWGEPVQRPSHKVTSLKCATTDPAVSEVTNGEDELAEDCTVLLWLMDTLGGPYHGLNWETGTTMDDWDSITVAVAGDTARVTRLNPIGDGRLPDSLTSLDGLTWLSLSGLTGNIPDLSKLTELEDLDLDNNQLTGNIPNLSALTKTKLETVYLSNNQLSGNIPDLSNLPKLRIVDLSDNQLRGNIPNLTNLPELKTLTLNDNQLSGNIPTSLNGLAALENLRLYNNRLSGDIPDLSGLTKLKILDLSNNQLSGDLPSSLNGRTSLTRLNLSHNAFSAGAIPTWLTSLTDLTRLDLSHTNRTGAIPDLRSLSKLERLDLSHNAFADGAIPTWFTNVTTLNVINLSHTNRTGTIPEVLGTIAELVRLHLHTNPLRGSLPADWGNASNSLTFLRVLDLRHTAVRSDPLPNDLQGRTNLQVWRSPSVVLSTDATHPVKDFTIRSVPKGTDPLPLVYRAGAPANTTFPADAGVYEITALDSTATNASAITTTLDTALEVCLPLPAGLPASAAYLYRYQPHATDPDNQPGSWVRQSTGRRTKTEDYITNIGSNLNQSWEREVRVCAQVDQFSHFRVGRYPSSGGGAPGGGGGGGGSSRDDHGNTAGSATRIAPGGRTAGELNTSSDVDYFTLTAPHAGVLVVETSGATDTRGTVWQDGVALASAGSGGSGQNFRLSVRVAAGPVVIAVRGNGRQTGRYVLQTALVVGYLENPAPSSFQSGLGLISGWVCAAEGVAIEIEQANGEVVELEAAYGTERADTAAICGDSDNGFGVLVNWNLLGDGAHTVRVLVNGVALGVQLVPGLGVVPAVVDGIELGRAPVTVTTLGAEFRTGLQGSFLVADFPRAGEQVRVVWQESQQNFVLAPVELGAALTPTPSSGGIEGVLENPGPASYQSGISVISGWVCVADEVVIEIDGQPIAAAAGTERGDTLDTCGDVDNGFGLLVNWAEFGAGEHEVVALVDGVELSRALVTVTMVDETEPFVRGLTKRVELPGFPTPEETVTLEWQQSQQNFVITGVD